MSDDTHSPPPEDLLVAVVEAVIFAAGEPVPLNEIVSALGDRDERQIEQALDSLVDDYGHRGGGLLVEKVAGGVRLATRSEVGPWVRRFFRYRNRTRLSAAALETLAIVAYRQPVTAPEIQAIRGVDPTASLKSLLEKRMVRILGKKKVVGSPLLYGTSREFLVHFGLNRLEDLPPIDDFNELLGTLEGVASPIPASLATLGSGGSRATEEDVEEGTRLDVSDEE